MRSIIFMAPTLGLVWKIAIFTEKASYNYKAIKVAVVSVELLYNSTFRNL